VPQGKPRKTFQLWTQQRFVLGYDGARGIKNGFTTLARYTLIAASTRGDRTVLVTILRSPKNAWKDAAALSDWAFRYGGRAEPVGTLVEPGSPEATSAPAAPPAAPPADRVVAASSLPVDTSSTAALIGWGVVTIAATVVALRARVLLRQRRRARG
jgi:D-alanyl-D-alanine carboxypeptidase (penicillin-binding protein 5/6)